MIKPKLLLLFTLILFNQLPAEEIKPMFAVIYRGYVQPGCEEQYQKYWKIVASYFVKERGALGSTLHKTKDGMWIAYSRWPDKPSRDASWPRGNESINLEFPPEIHEAIVKLKASLDEERHLPEICMDIIEEISFETESNLIFLKSKD